MLRKPNLTVITLLSGLFSLVGSQSVDAAFKVRVSFDGGTTFSSTVQDNMAGDSNGALGQINTTFSTTGLTMTFVFTASKPTLGSPYMADMSMSFGGIISAGFSGTIYVEMTDTDFAAPSYPVGLGYLTADLGGSLSNIATASYTSYLSNSNGEFDIPGSFSVTDNSADSVPASIEGFATSPYSLTARTAFTITASSVTRSFSFDNRTTFELPEPATVLSALFGVPALGYWVRRRRVVQELAA